MKSRIRQIDRRRFVAGSAAVAGAAVLGARAARAQGTPVASPAPVVPPVANTEVSGEVRYSLVVNQPTDVAQSQELFDTAFREQYPNVTVTVEPAPQGGSGGDPLLAQMVAGDAPDILDTWASRALPYADAGQILDLEPLIQRDFTPDALADFYPWTLEAQVFPGGLRWGLPRYVNITVLVYNTDLLDAAGIPAPDETLDHDAYRAMILALTQRDGGRTRVYGGHSPMWAFSRFANKVEVFGGQVVDPADRTTALFGSPEAQAAAEWHRALTFDEGALTDQPFLNTSSGTGGVISVRANFAAGRIATMEEGFYPFALADDIGDSFNWAVAVPPAGPAGRSVLGSADGFSIWAGSENQEAAWEVVKFMAGPAYQRFLVGATGYLPVRRSLIPEWQRIVTESRPVLANVGIEVGPAVLETGNPHERPLFADDFAATEIVEPALERIFVVGDTPVTFLAEVADQVTAAQQS